MNLLSTLATISGMTLLSRITGLMREFLIARTFGASVETDAFFVAFRIPNLLRRLFAEGAFSQAFVPILADYKNNQGEVATKRLIDQVATVLVWILIMVCAAGMLGASVIVYVMAAGLKAQPAAFQTAVGMTQIMFPYIVCMSLVALASGVLNTWREFRIPAFTPVLLNLSFILSIVWLAPFFAHPIYVLAFAVLLGGVLQLAIQIPALKKIGMWPRLHFHPLQALRDPGVLRVLRQMGPAIFAVSVAQISLMINTNIATHLAQGSVSWLSYADRLMEFPTALLGVALGTILLPSLAKAYAVNNAEEYSSLLDWGLRLTFLLALPAAVLLATLAQPMTATLFNYGKFDAHDVFMTSQALLAYGVGLTGLILVKILAPGFYARQNIKTPVKIAFGVLCATQIFNLIFVPWLQHAGLALSIGLGACLNAGFLYWKLQRRGIYQAQAGWGIFFAKLFVALILMGILALSLSMQIDWMALHLQPWRRIGWLCIILCASGASYLAALYAMGFRLHDFKRTG